MCGFCIQYPTWLHEATIEQCKIGEHMQYFNSPRTTKIEVIREMLMICNFTKLIIIDFILQPCTDLGYRISYTPYYSSSLILRIKCCQLSPIWLYENNTGYYNDSLANL